MASSKEYLAFILEQLSEMDGITYRSMMGEYIIYYHGKIAAYLCDDRLLVKNISCAAKMMPDAVLELPYEGAKPMLLVDNVDDKQFLKALFETMYAKLPEPKKKNLLKVKKITKKDIPEALELVWKVFLEFEAPDYSKEGVAEFRSTLDNQEFVKNLKFYGAFEGNEMVGIIAMRKPQHISLFFVKGNRHRKGIGRKLFERMKKDYEIQEFMVNSSPYAVEAYHHLGFTDMDTEQMTNGIRYVPMKYTSFCME